MSDKLRGGLEMFAAMTISGTIGWFVIMSGLTAPDIVFWRCLFGAIALLLLCLAMGTFRKGAISLRQLAIAAAGGVAVVLNWLLLFGAFPRASISIATVVYNTQPFMLVGIAAILFKERLTAAKLFWLSAGFVGMLLIVGGRSGTASASANYLTGIAMALGSAFFYSIAALVTKSLKGVPPHLITLVQLVVGMAMLGSIGAPSDLPEATSVWVLVVTLGVIHTGLSFTLMYGAIQRLQTHLVGALSFIYPVVAIGVDAVAFDRELSVMQLLGALAILLGAAGMMLGWAPPWLYPRPVDGSGAAPH